MSRVYLLRHGRTEANERRLYCGISDLPLCDVGQAELACLRARGGYPPLEGLRICTSGLQRAEQTLEALYGEVPHEVMPALQEMNFGAFEMHGYCELKKSPAYQAWINGDNEKNCCPGGESGWEMKQRVLQAFWPLTEQSTLIVSHGGPIAVIMQALLPEAGKNRYEWQPANGCGYAVEIPSVGTPRLLAVLPEGRVL